MSRRFRILAGGRSTEHDASIHSYFGVLHDLAARQDHGLRLEAVYFVDRAGAAYVHRAPHWPQTPEALASGTPLSTLGVLEELQRDDGFIFNLLHGNEGEDGAWQGVAEVLGLRGSFGPVLPSALTMNKWVQSLVAVGALGGSVAMPRTWKLDPHSNAGMMEQVVAECGGSACVVKPNRMGASHLTWRLHTPTVAGLSLARDRIAPYDPEVLVQEYVAGREYTCGCVEDAGQLVALPVIEAITSEGFLGHEEKHRAGKVRARLVMDDDEETSKIKEVSRRLFRVFGMEGMGRFDYIAAGGELWFLEANSIPGLMGGSAFPRMLRAAGLDLADLVRCCIDAEARRPIRTKLLEYAIDSH